MRWIKRMLGMVGYGTPADFRLAEAMGARIETIQGRTIARYSSGLAMGMGDDLEYLSKRGFLFPAPSRGNAAGEEG